MVPWGTPQLNEQLLNTPSNSIPCQQNAFGSVEGGAFLAKKNTEMF